MPYKLGHYFWYKKRVFNYLCWYCPNSFRENMLMVLIYHSHTIAKVVVVVWSSLDMWWSSWWIPASFKILMRGPKGTPRARSLSSPTYGSSAAPTFSFSRRAAYFCEQFCILRCQVDSFLKRNCMAAVQPGSVHGFSYTMCAPKRYELGTLFEAP